MAADLNQLHEGLGQVKGTLTLLVTTVQELKQTVEEKAQASMEAREACRSEVFGEITALKVGRAANGARQTERWDWIKRVGTVAMTVSLSLGGVVWTAIQIVEYLGRK